MQTGCLASLPFVDMILGRDFCDIKGLAGTDGFNVSVGPEHSDEVRRLRALCESTRQSKSADEFTLVFDGQKFRVTAMHDDDESVVWLLSRSGAQVRGLDDLNLPQSVIKQLMKPDLRGLVLIVGGFGAGKTTTCGSLFAGWIERFGGVGISFESPPELDMSGKRGRGRLLQIPVSESPDAEDGYHRSMQRGLRSRADAFLVGEVRTANTAMEVQHIANTDRPIFSTLHAESVEQGLMKFQAFCRHRDMAQDAINELLASSIAAVIHLSVDIRETLSGHVRRVTPTCLIFDKGVVGNSLRAKIREGKFSSLNEEIDTQGKLRQSRINNF